MDSQLRSATVDEDFGDELVVLERMEEELTTLEVPLAYMEEAYNLRQHVGYVQQRIREHIAERELGVQTAGQQKTVPKPTAPDDSRGVRRRAA